MGGHTNSCFWFPLKTASQSLRTRRGSFSDHTSSHWQIMAVWSTGPVSLQRAHLNLRGQFKMPAKPKKVWARPSWWHFASFITSKNITHQMVSNNRYCKHCCYMPSMAVIHGRTISTVTGFFLMQPQHSSCHSKATVLPVPPLGARRQSRMTVWHYHKTHLHNSSNLGHRGAHCTVSSMVSKHLLVFYT